MKNKLLNIFNLIAIRCCIVLISITLIFSGAIKAIDPAGMVYKVQEYLYFWHIFIPDNSILLKGMIIILLIIEFMLGINLLLGIKKKQTIISILCFFLIMTILTLYSYLVNPVHDCGCFGEAIKLNNFESLIKNIILLGLSSFLFFQQNKIQSISTRSRWITSIWSFIYILGITLYSFNYIPIIDFTSWKIGKNIREAYIGIDTSKSGQEISNLFIYNDKGNDVTYNLISNKKSSFILIINNPSTADIKYGEKINNLYKFCKNHQINMYAISSPGKDGINQWINKTKANYPIYFGESSQLKAMVRSNPGLLLIINGTIIQKWGKNNLPDLTKQNINIEISKYANKYYGITLLLLIFFIPLMIFILFDKIWIFKH